jgi:serine/threonine protein kinase
MTETELFAAALEKPAPERAAYLAGACAGDEPLRQRVEALLRAHSEPDDVLDRPPAGERTEAYRPISEGPGTVIGPYKLLQQIGEGGFGVVFMAEQEKPVRRTVALKIIKPGMDTSLVIARFESERQALAIMDHPNIAKVLDAGATESGRPYFVMELVKGVPVTEFCDKNRMPAGQRLKLFIYVCHAIQHAHHKGVIHRDVKPSNVLVTLHDGVPVVKVIDFGVAKATVQKLTEKTLFTAYGQMIGTPAYMSPEQAEMSGLDIDTRSDIYSLGVLLYELLTGTTPLEAKRLRQAGYAEMQRLIREEEAPRPSTRLSSLGDSATMLAGNRGTDPKQLSRLLAGDLDWIVMKALEKDRNRRYGTPGDFAADLERYLRHDAILARPPSAAYKLAKFARRNRGMVVTTGAVAAALLIGTAVAAWQAVVATRAKGEALAALTKMEEARAEAQAKEAEANAVVTFFEERVLAAGRPKGTLGGLGHDVSLRDAVKSSVPALATNFKNRPLVEARLRYALGTTFGLLGEYSQSLEQAEKARDLSLKHLGPDDRRTLNCMNNVGRAHQNLGHPKEALEIHEETLAAQRRVLPPDDPDTIRSMGNLALCHHALGHDTEAHKLYEGALAALKRVYGPEDRRTLSGMMSVAISHFNLSRFAEARERLEETLAIQKRVLPPGDPEIFGTMHNLANTYERLNRCDEALGLREEALAASERLLPPDHPETLGRMHNLALSYQHLNRHADALSLFEKVVAGYKRVFPPEHPITLNAMNSLAGAHVQMNHAAEALKLFEETAAIQKRVHGPEHRDTLLTRYNFVVCYEKLGRYAEAIQFAEDLLAVRKRVLPTDDFDTLESMNQLAWLLATVADEKLRDPRRAVELAAHAAAAAPPQVPFFQGTLGTAHYRTGDWKAAVADLERAVGLRKPDDSDNAYNGFFLAMAHRQLGEKDKAREWFDKSVTWMEKRNKQPIADMKRFRTEAAGLLGVKE